MSAPRREPGARNKEQGAKSEEQGARRVWVGSVARRPAAEVVEELGALARKDRRRMTTPVTPAPRPPTRFSITWRPPLPPRQPINPYLPDSPDRASVIRAAAVRARALEEVEAYHLAEADAEAARPREKTPPRDAEDYFDLARWNRRRWL